MPKYQVQLDNYLHPNFARDSVISRMKIPKTTREVVWDTESGEGQLIYSGYLNMFKSQKNLRDSEKGSLRIKLTEKDSELDRFKEAINLFFVYLVGDRRDNLPQVSSIEAIVENKPNNQRRQ